MVVRRFLGSFLRRFGFCSNDSIPDAPSAVDPVTAAPAPISETERLSRYVTTRDHYSTATNEVRFRAFLPARADNELSIMRTRDLDEPGVWALGDAVTAPSGRTAYARADFHAPDVVASFVVPWRLTVRPDEPPPRHALIEGWPPPAETEIRKSLAQQLRARTKLAVRKRGQVASHRRSLGNIAQSQRDRR